MKNYANFHVLLLKNRLILRQQKNARFSLRNFARILEISPTALSQVLNNKRGLSEAAALKIADKLKLTPEEKKLFLLSVSSSHSRNLKNKLKSSIELATLSKEGIVQRTSDKTVNDIISSSGPFYLETKEVLDLVNRSEIHKTFRYKLNGSQFCFRILHTLKCKNTGRALKDFIQITFNEDSWTASTVYFIQKENEKFKTFFNNVFDGNHRVTSLIEANQNSTVRFNKDGLPVIPHIHFVYLNSNKHVIGKMEYTKKNFTVTGTLIDFDEKLIQTSQKYRLELVREMPQAL